MPSIAEQLAALPLVDNLNRNSPEAPAAAPWEKASFPTEIGYLEEGWGYYPHNGGTSCAALYSALTLPAGGAKGWAVSTEIRQKSSSIAGSPYWEIWLYLAKAAKTGLRAAAYQEEAGGTKYKIVLEKWNAGVKETLGEVAGINIKGTGTLAGGCLALVYLGGNVYVFTREESAASFVERLKAATAVPAGEYAGIGGQAATEVNYYPAVENFCAGEITGSVAEQLLGLPIIDTLKKAAKPASMTKLPWALTEGSWSEAAGWSPTSFSANPPTGTRSGFYINTGKQAGKVAIGLKKTTGSLAVEGRQFELWLHYQGGEKASGYQLAVVTDKNSDGKVKYTLKKFVEGAETSLLATAEGLPFNENDTFYLARIGNTLLVYRRSGESLPELIGEAEDSTFTEGYVGFGGNGSNPRLINLQVGALVTAQMVPLGATSGTSSTTLALRSPTTVVLEPTTGGSSTTLALKAKTMVPLLPTTGGSSTTLTMRVKLKAQRLRVRRGPAMRLYLLATAPSGKVYRWGEDERGADSVFADLVDSDAVPGGYKELACSLPRKPDVDYGDMAMGTELELFGAGQQKIGEYRLERAPRTSGDQISMDPAAYGYQGHLSDDASAQEIFIDSDLSAWAEPTAARRLYLYNNGIHIVAATSVGRSPLQPADTPAGVINDFTGTTNFNQSAGEADYYGGGVDIGEVKYDYRQLSAYAADPTWETNVALSALDTFVTFQVGANHQRSTALAQSVVATAAGMKWARLRDKINNSGYTGQLGDVTAWQYLMVFGRHGIDPVGVWPDIGLLASDVIAYALERWAPLLRFTTGDMGTIRPTAFSIPHLAFKEAGPIADWITQANRFELNEWGVWNDRTFFLNPRGAREGRKRWVARVSPSHLQETGQQMERVWNGVVVEYQDVGGGSRTVGPPESSATYTDDRLLDPDPLNPANQIEGLRRWTKIAANGASTPEGAIRIGQLFLEQTKELDGSGSATLTGYVEDDNGQLWPYYCVHAGDLIRFVDANEPGWRYVVSAQRTRATRSVDIDLDAPPDSLTALLERLDVVLIPIGG